MAAPDEVHGQLMDMIQRYLAQHPNASDSLEGICDWWIPRQKLLEAREDVRKALELLVQAGSVATETTADGQVLYRALRHDEVAGPKPPPSGRH
jgi:hypothetical protein